MRMAVGDGRAAVKRRRRALSPASPFIGERGGVQ